MPSFSIPRTRLQLIEEKRSTTAQLSLRVVRTGDPIVRQGVVHLFRTHFVQGRIPDGVLFGEEVCEELQSGKKEEKFMKL